MSAAALVACGGFDDPPPSGTHLGGSTGTSGGSSSTTIGGTTSTAGSDTTSVAGTFATGGGGASGVAGDSSVAGTTSTAGTFTGTAGTGTVTPPPFCSPTATPVQPRVPLPFAVTTAFTPSGYEGGDPGMNGGGQIAAGMCTDRAPGAIGSCAKYTYTPTTPATWAGVAYIRGYQGFGSTGHAPLCLADGATSITFYAKGAVGGEVVGFAGGTAMGQDFTLTADWAMYTIPLGAAAYNTDADGLDDGFFWKIAPAAGSTPTVETFYVDDIQFVGASGGTGGAGGSGGSGGSGGASGSAGSAGSAGTGGAAAGSGGTGGT
ncbi:MAG TPA: hypothetical protein VHV51_09085 [Polyangiaceae bacterium]|nr:hypothetical protein [Polyangiaceae bacterium]